MKTNASLFRHSILARTLTCAAVAALAGTASASVLPSAPDVAQKSFMASNPEAALYRTGDRVTTVYGKAFSFGTSAQASVDRFVSQHLSVFGIGADEIAPGSLAGDGASVREFMPREDGGMKFTLISYLQVRDGLPVFRGDLRFVVRNEPGAPMVLARSAARDLGNFVVDAEAAAAPNVAGAFADAQLRFPGIGNFSVPEVVIWAGVESAPSTPTLAVRFYGTAGEQGTPNYGRWLILADAKTGKTVWTEDQIVHTDVTGSVKAMVTPGKKADICETEVLTVLPYARVAIGATAAFTDINGNFTIPNAGTTAVTVSSGLRGRWFSVFTPSSAYTALTMSATPPGPANFIHNPTNSNATFRSAVNAYYNSNVVRDHALQYNPTFPTIGTQAEFRVNVAVSGTCNAYYDGGSINFFPAGGGCPSTAFGDVVHHEYGHHLVNVAGSGQGQYGEGYGDLVGVLISDDPILGYGFTNNCGFGIRTAVNSIQYPCSAEIHECGQLITGCFWDTRNALVAAGVSNYRDLLATWAYNSVVLHTGDLITPEITLDVLTLDDNDANINNGTPHYNEINTGFSAHNMPGPVLNFLNFSFPAGRPELIDPAGGTTFTVQVVGVNGNILDAGSVNLRVDPENDGSFATVNLSPASPGVYNVVMPASSCGTTVPYYFTASTTTASVATSPASAPASTYIASAAVSTTTGFSDSFQTDLGWTKSNTGGQFAFGQWARVTPGNFGNGDPAGDADGSGLCFVTGNSAGNDVSRSSTLVSPTLDATGASYGLSYARWFFTEPSGGTDTFVVEVSNDNGSTWTNFETISSGNPDALGGWKVKLTDLASKITPTSTMKVRFITTDNEPYSVVEAGVDSVKLVVFNCGATCAADFNGDGFLTGDDFDAYVSAFEAGNVSADFDHDGFVTGDDFDAYVSAFQAGC